MKKLLVTGAAGFIGSNFAHYWHANNPGDSIVALDALTYAGNRHNLTALMGKDQFKFVKGSICDLALVESFTLNKRKTRSNCYTYLLYSFILYILLFLCSTSCYNIYTT